MLAPNRCASTLAFVGGWHLWSVMICVSSSCYIVLFLVCWAARCFTMAMISAWEMMSRSPTVLGCEHRCNGTPLVMQVFLRLILLSFTLPLFVIQPQAIRILMLKRNCKIGIHS